jgi:Na+/citrate or Na+/malate symporter
MNKRLALKLMFAILIALLILHSLIYTEVIPYDKVWAGKLNSVEEMKSFESFSILFNLFIIIVLLIKNKLLIQGKENSIINILIWFFAAFFALNTIGNLFAQSMLELILGTLLTILSSYLCFIIVKKSAKSS